MIIKKGKIIKSLKVYLEDDNLDEYMADKEDYSFVSVLSYKRISPESDWRVIEKPTPKIYLSKSIDEIFANFSDTVRNEIRRTNGLSGLKIICDDKNLSLTYKFYKEFEFLQKRVPESYSMFKAMRLFNAYLDGELISSIMCVDSFPYLRAWAICSKRLKAENKDLYKIIGFSTKRLIFEICKLGKKNNYQVFDLGGVNLIDPKKAGITKFKSSFGGAIEDQYTYEYKSKLFKMMEKLVAIKLIVKKLFR